MLRRLNALKPPFWNQTDTRFRHLPMTFNFKRKWKLLVFFTTFMALLPLFVMSLVELSLTHRIIEEEVKTGMKTILDTTAKAFSYTSDPEKSAIEYLAQTPPSPDQDFFIVDAGGVLMTPSLFYGEAGSTEFKQIFQQDTASGINDVVAPDGQALILGAAAVTGTEMTFVLIKTRKGLSDIWLKPRMKLAGYLVVSIFLILLSIMGTASYLINRIYSADQKRIQALHHAEHANKLASIGRLASGVAHEINNPLAIISQKAGLMTDLLTLENQKDLESRLIPLANDILDVVTRCGTITKRLLDFARHMEPSIEPVNIADVIQQILAFLEKEALRRNITVHVDNTTAMAPFLCDKGSLQQIFLNLFENAFTAMETGGTLSVKLRRKDQYVRIMISDTGTGIPDEDLNKIFEPFFSSKTKSWGTGLGLSITYGLVKELGGDIMVKSQLGTGTEFTLMLPVAPLLSKDEKTCESH